MVLIGVTMSYDYNKNQAKINENFFRAIELAGGLPVCIPPIRNEAALKDLSKRLDGLVLSGGPDVDPMHYNEKPIPQLGNIDPDRDTTEILITREMFELKKPILGICRGTQVLNVAFGGKLIQDIAVYLNNPLKHDQDAPRWHKSHEIEICEENSIIFRLFGHRRLRVNSFHHQAIKEVAPGFKVCATAPDEIIEAIESVDKDRFCVGVQWHPEEMLCEPGFFSLFEALIEAAEKAESLKVT